MPRDAALVIVPTQLTASPGIAPKQQFDRDVLDVLAQGVPVASGLSRIACCCLAGSFWCPSHSSNPRLLERAVLRVAPDVEEVAGAAERAEPQQGELGHLAE
jgi:hypothetical protein